MVHNWLIVIILGCTAFFHHALSLDLTDSVIDSVAVIDTPSVNSDDPLPDTLQKSQEINRGSLRESGTHLSGLTADTLVKYVKETGSAIVIEGIIIEKVNGEVPDGTIKVRVDSSEVLVDSTGEFSIALPVQPYYHVRVISELYQSVDNTVTYNEGRTNYFLTIQLDRKLQSADSPITEQRDTSAIPWTISGTIIDSRFDLVIESDSTVLLFDGDTVTVTKNVNFIVSTFISGTHTFFLTIPGYHPVTFPVVLHEKEKQLFVTIPTTIVSAAISRREITVSAKRLPVHRSAEISKVAVTRKELQRTTSTLNDRCVYCRPFRGLPQNRMHQRGLSCAVEM